MTEEQEEQGAKRYFREIENTFIRLRGAPLLLSPADWRVARDWHRRGIPLDLVVRTLEEIFAKRQERGARGRVQSLRYCAAAVEAAWGSVQELTLPGERRAASAFSAEDVRKRLAALAEHLPKKLAQRAETSRRILELQGDVERVERT